MADAPAEYTTIDDSTLVSGDSMMGDAVAVARLGPGKSIGSHIVLARRGVGRSGVLYHAYEPRRDRHVAIRLLPPQESKTRDPDAGEIRAIEQLQREAKELAAIEHCNLVGIHEVGELHGVVYLVMDYLAGGTFAAWTKPGRDWREIVDCLAGIGTGLAMLHRAGLVHRDVRPANILFDADGQARLVDFAFHRGGFSSRRNTILTNHKDDETSAESLQAPLIRMGTWIGTPAYMAPEQYAGEELDGRADQFAFCVMLHETLYGRRPFEARTLDGLFLAIEEGRLQSVDHRGVPKRIYEAITRGLAHDRSKRWPNMEALVEALCAEPDPTWRRRAAILALTTSLVAAVVALSLQGPLAPGQPGAAGPAQLPLDAELDRVQTMLEASDLHGADDLLASLEAQLASAPAHLRARHHLLLAQSLGTTADAERLLHQAVLELTAEPEDPPSPSSSSAEAEAEAEMTRALAIELGLRQELHAVADATNRHDLQTAREHVERARQLLERRPNPLVADAIARWEAYYQATQDADR